MQVQRIQNNYIRRNYNPQFKALRISPDAGEALMKMTTEKLMSLKKAGEELKNTKFYHLNIDEEGNSHISSPWSQHYYDLIAPNKYDTELFLDSEWLYGDKISYSSPEDCQSAYREIMKALKNSSSFEGDVLLIKHLEASALGKQIVKDSAKLEKVKDSAALNGVRVSDNFVDDLIAKYSKDYPEDVY